ncbi:MAG: nucleotide exchange factor GrpE [Gammaproteobacteria bacterium]|nr:nucleotide exchange factor GrpE [Gammaproteobacteria bacterium]
MTSKDKEHKTTSNSALHQKLGAEKAPVFHEEENDSETDALNHLSPQELKTRLTEAENKAKENWERMLRMQAEGDNLRRRAELDVQDAHKYALKKFAVDLLPVLDSLERAIDSHTNDEAGAGTLLDGVRLTLKMFQTTCEKFGIKQINPIDEIFNPEFHEVVSAQPAPSVKPGTVLNVLQKGYLLNERLIRPALVIVSK